MVYLIVLGFTLIDFTSGMIWAIKNHAFKSSIMREGLYHKCGSAICIIFGALVDYAQKYIDLGVNIPLGGAICTYIILMECGSIIENIGKINPNIVPTSIKKHFAKIE